MADDDLAVFMVGMLLIVKDPSRWVAENGQRFVEGDPVLAKLAFAFAGSQMNRTSLASTLAQRKCVG